MLKREALRLREDHHKRGQYALAVAKEFIWLARKAKEQQQFICLVFFLIEYKGIKVLLGFWVMRQGMIFIIFASLQLVEEGITKQSYKRPAMLSSLTTRLVVYSARQDTPMALR